MSDADFQNTPMRMLHEKLQGTGFWRQFAATRDSISLLDDGFVSQSSSSSPAKDGEVRSISIHSTRAFEPVCIPALKFAL